MPAPYVLPGQLLRGPDGNLWFPTIAYANFTSAKPSGAIGRLAPDGKITLFPLLTPNTYPTSITFTRDGNLWFLAFHGNGKLAPNVDTAPRFTGGAHEIGRMTPDGHFSFIPFPQSNVDPIAIAAGPDGNLWIAQNLSNQQGNTMRISRMTLSGAFTDFTPASSSPYDYVQNLIAGSDGNLWFSISGSTPQYHATGTLGKITPQGQIRLFPLGENPLRDFTVGPDNNIWFTTFMRVGRITAAGKVSWFDPNRHANANNSVTLAGITSGPDGNLWIATSNAAIGRLTPTGTFTFYPLTSNTYFDNGSTSLTLGQLKGVAQGSDGTLWLTDNGQVGHFL